MSELFFGTRKLKISSFLFLFLFISNISVGEENVDYSGPGDNKNGYETSEYVTNSLSLDERKGRKADLIKYVTVKQLGLPLIEIPSNNPISREKIELGKKLFLRVRDLLELNEIPKVSPSAPIKNVILEISEKRLGVTAVTTNQKIEGLITDGDLRRMLSNIKEIENITASDIMTKNPRLLEGDTLAIKGVEFIKKYGINHIILTKGKSLSGLVNIQDFITEGLI